MKKLKGVMIGAGYFSHYHADGWNRIAEVDMVAVCDTHKEKAVKFSGIYDLPKVYQDAEKMLDKEEPDFVDIITPPDAHLPLIKLAMDRDIPVICQKPLANTFGEVMEINDLLSKYTTRFMVHENWRFQPWYRQIKILVQSGVIGEKIFQYAFHLRTGDGWGANAYLDRQPYFRTMPRLFMHETGVHFIDTFRYLAGEITDVYAQMRQNNPLIKGEDAVMVLMNFSGGSAALLDANRYNEPSYEDPRYTFGKMLVEGEKGSLHLHPNGQISIKRLGEKAYFHDFQPSRLGFAGDSVKSCQQHFIDRLSSGNPFETELSDYLKSLQAVEAVYQSHLESKRIYLNLVSL
ncbi:Gfo/Idh/MocA family protein [Pararhodonellum marinum]|uniref:Gfo/Idh/MocA family protein n=1 Tax=Pararhodonellum marinum TaxID=2755358 RepID=UPI00188FE0DB|nr:Gfo/Idh/MocA family oxidoreductase [Pararhodonellum marinum]